MSSEGHLKVKSHRKNKKSAKILYILSVKVMKYTLHETVCNMDPLNRYLRDFWYVTFIE